MTSLPRQNDAVISDHPKSNTNEGILSEFKRLSNWNIIEFIVRDVTPSANDICRKVSNIRRTKSQNLIASRRIW